jgi:hypothetical protein
VTFRPNRDVVLTPDAVVCVARRVLLLQLKVLSLVSLSRPAGSSSLAVAARAMSTGDWFPSQSVRRTTVAMATAEPAPRPRATMLSLDSSFPVWTYSFVATDESMKSVWLPPAGCESRAATVGVHVPVIQAACVPRPTLAVVSLGCTAASRSFPAALCGCGVQTLTSTRAHCRR